jgi:Ser/Thr protein kinase RdoA (MazF antagonist)
MFDSKVIIILKEIPWYCSSKLYAEYELSFQKELRGLGVPIPQIYETVNGNLFCSEDYGNGEKYIFAQNFEKGDSWKGSVKETISAAITLSNLHTASLKITDKMLKYKPPESNVFILAKKMLDVAKTNIQEKKEDSCEFEDYYNYALTRIEKYMNIAVEKGYNSIKIPIHGDYNPWNLVFSEVGSLSAVLDFNYSIIDHPVHDVAATITIELTALVIEFIYHQSE